MEGGGMRHNDGGSARARERVRNGGGGREREIQTRERGGRVGEER